MRVYGIPNCDKVKKALAWLDAHRIPYTFHDYKKDGVDANRLKHWADQVGWEKLLNTNGTTWRNLPEERRLHLDRTLAIQLMIENPSIIRRPILELDKSIYLGFDESDYSQWFFQAA